MEKIITIDDIRSDEYGNTWVKDKEGNEHKVGAKRPREIHDMLANSKDLAVKFTYATFNDRTYIANAELCKDLIDVEEHTGEKPQVYTRLSDSEKPIPGQQIGMTTKEVGDMIRTKMLTVIFGPFAAANLVTWYRGQILGTTKSPFDGDKLPKFETKNKGE